MTGLPVQDENLKPRKILILKAKAEGLRGAEIFLKNRGWEITSFCDAKTFMSELSKNPLPDYVILSFDHTHAQIRKLPKVIESSLNVPVIVIAENPSTSLSESAHTAVVFPPISGPSLERAILRIEMSRRKVDSSSRAISGAPRPDAAGIQVFAGAGRSRQRLMPYPHHKFNAGGMIIQTSVPKLKTVNHTLLLENASEYALNTLGQPAETEAPVQLGECSKVTCYEIQSDRSSGYLLLAFADDVSESDFFALDLRRCLNGFVQLQGESITISPHFDLHLVSFSFWDWALEEAEFLKFSLHGQNEVAMAFVPERMPEPAAPEPSVDPSMFALDLFQIQAGSRIEFDLHLHMPMNKKFLRCFRRGQVVELQHREKLLRAGHTKLHIHLDEIPRLHPYLVQNFLNERVSRDLEAKSLTA